MQFDWVFHVEVRVDGERCVKDGFEAKASDMVIKALSVAQDAHKRDSV